MVKAWTGGLGSRGREGAQVTAHGGRVCRSTCRRFLISDAGFVLEACASLHISSFWVMSVARGLKVCVISARDQNTSIWAACTDHSQKCDQCCRRYLHSLWLKAIQNSRLLPGSIMDIKFPVFQELGSTRQGPGL